MPVETRRLRGRLNSFKFAYFFANTGEGLVATGFRLCCKQSIQHSGLALAENYMHTLRRSHAGQWPNTAQPLFRQQAETTITKTDHSFAIAQRLQQCGKLRLDLSIFNFSVEFEPIHAARNLNAECAGTAEILAFSLHVPACSNQRANDAGHLGGSYFPRGFWIVEGSPSVPYILHACFTEHVCGGLFGYEVAAQKTAIVSFVPACGGIVFGYYPVLILKRDIRFKASGVVYA